MNEPLDEPDIDAFTEQEEIMIKQADFIYDCLNEDSGYTHRGKSMAESNKQWGIE